MKHLKKFNTKNFVKSKKNRIFASDDDSEPTALAVDSGRPIPTLTGESAIRFLERAAKVEEEARKAMSKPPSLEFLKRELTFKKFFLETEERQLEERKKEIANLENKIKDLEKELDVKS